MIDIGIEIDKYDEYINKQSSVSSVSADSYKYDS